MRLYFKLVRNSQYLFIFCWIFNILMNVFVYQYEQGILFDVALAMFSSVFGSLTFFPLISYFLKGADYKKAVQELKEEGRLVSDRKPIKISSRYLASVFIISLVGVIAVMAGISLPVVIITGTILMLTCLDLCSKIDERNS